jgi:hypothetical protein
VRNGNYLISFIVRCHYRYVLIRILKSGALLVLAEPSKPAATHDGHPVPAYFSFTRRRIKGCLPKPAKSSGLLCITFRRPLPSFRFQKEIFQLSWRDKIRRLRLSICAKFTGDHKKSIRHCRALCRFPFKRRLFSFHDATKSDGCGEVHSGSHML